MESKSSISQLDLLLLGRRGITSRIAGVERTMRELVLGQGSGAEEDNSLVRPNLLINSSFEFYNRNAVRPNDWNVNGAAVLAFGVTGADGSTVISCEPGATLSQPVAGGLAQPKSSAILSVAAKANSYGAKVILSAVHTPGLVFGPIYRIDTEGNEAQTNEVPGDGKWYRFWCPFIINGGNTLLAIIGSAGDSTTTIFLDAAKYEKEDNSDAFIEPSAYIGGDWGASVHLRNLSADNITAGTLTVGGSSSNNPRISVRDGNDVEIITIGDPNKGFYGIDVKQGAGVRVSGSGSIEITGTGNLNVSGGGDINVSGNGDINITNDGNLNVSGTGDINVSGGGDIRVTGGGSVVVDGGLVNVVGTGTIRAGTTGAQRIDITAAGITGYNNAGMAQVRLDSADGKLRVLGPGAVSVEGGGSLIAGTPAASRVELKSGGIYAYNNQNEETMVLSTADGTLTIDADALIVDGTAVFDAITVTGAVTIMQDLVLGANVLFVDTSGRRVGINRAPDAQFDLDVNGNIRAGGYIVGKHAIQLSDALLIAHYDGAGVVGTNLTGDPTGHRGQVATITGSVSYPAGKFNKGLQLASGATVSYAASGNIRAASGTLMSWVRRSGTGEQTILAWGSTSPNWITLGVNSSGRLQARYGTGTIVGPTLTENMWHHVALTWGGGTVNLYLNGVRVNPELTGAATPTPATAIFVGTSANGANRWQGIIDDLVILATAAEASLVRAVYESNAPVFAESSNWAFRTANTLAWADEEGLWARSATGAEAFGVSGVNGKSWGNIGQNLDAGDVLIGNTTNYLLWDASTGTMTFKGNGAGLTNINGANITTGSITANKLNVSNLSAISANLGNITAGNITGVTITGSTIQTSGNNPRVVLNSSGLVAYDASGDIQISLSTNDNGELRAGAGSVRLNKDGIIIGAWPTRTPLSNSADAILWKRVTDYSTTTAYIKSYWDSYTTWLDIRALQEDTTGTGCVIDLVASGEPYKSNIRMFGGASGSLQLYGTDVIVGSTSGLGVGKLIVDGSIGFAKNSNKVITQTNGLILNYNGPISIGTTETSYLPNSSNWNTGGAGLLLNCNTFTSIVFNNNSSRADSIVYNNGTIYLGYNIGWGAANTVASGNFSAIGNITAHRFYSNGDDAGYRWKDRTDQNVTWLWYATGGSARLYNNNTAIDVLAITNSGNVRFNGRVGIGTEFRSDTALTVDGFSNDSSGFSIISRRNNDTNLFYSRNDGYLWAINSWAIGSDERLKENIQDLPSERSRMRKVRFRKFKRKMNGVEDFGVIAQELREIYPELVTEVHHPFDPEDETELAVNYTGLMVFQGKALQELDDEVDQLRQRVHQQIETLEAKIAVIEAQLKKKQK